MTKGSASRSRITCNDSLAVRSEASRKRGDSENVEQSGEILPGRADAIRVTVMTVTTSRSDFPDERFM